MSQQRRILYINVDESIKVKLDAIAAFIIAMAPNHPLFPQPLRPSRLADIEAGAYNIQELTEGCARLLVQHISQGIVSNETLGILSKEVDVLRSAPLVAINGHFSEAYLNDLAAIHAHMMAVEIAIPYATNRRAAPGTPNLKTPLMTAILYAYQYIQQEG